MKIDYDKLIENLARSELSTFDWNDVDHAMLKPEEIMIYATVGEIVNFIKEQHEN